MEFEFNIGDKTHKISVELKDGLYQVELEKKVYQVDCCPISPHCFSMLIEDKVHTVFFADGFGEKYFALKGVQFMLKKPELREQERRTSSAKAPVHDGLISTPMPGKIVKVLVKEGEEVLEGQNLIIVESMKMENNIASPFKAKVLKINVSSGELAQPGESLIDLEKI